MDGLMDGWMNGNRQYHHLSILIMPSIYNFVFFSIQRAFRAWQARAHAHSQINARHSVTSPSREAQQPSFDQDVDAPELSNHIIASAVNLLHEVDDEDDQSAQLDAVELEGDDDRDSIDDIIEEVKRQHPQKGFWDDIDDKGDEHEDQSKTQPLSRASPLPSSPGRIMHSYLTYMSSSLLLLLLE